MTAQRYLVTARKYRPQTFGDLVAQDHVTETLKNALRLDRLAHAYLFSGPRGVGKTTAARILSKAINCTAPEAERPDGVEPCRECDSCRAFEEGRSLSIFEIDAASNNKVEDIRDLRETVRIPPQGSRKKVYIIDEVHMLSNAAFNALLKTLEEPPPHVLFIFATTEPHKVLPTILSRCQRFDFRRIPVPEIVQRLAGICEAEDISADEASLMLIARKGDGALRDSLSVFDQSVALCGTDLRYAELAQALGVVDVDLFFEVSENILKHDSAAMLRLVDRVVRTGHDLQEFLGGLSEHIRNLLVGCTTGEASLIEATDALQHRYLETCGGFNESDLLRLLTLTSEAESAVRSSSQPRLKLELALLKMAALIKTTDLRTILRQLEDLPPDTPPAGDTPQRSRGDEDGGQPVMKTEPKQGPPPREAPVRQAEVESSGAAAPETAIETDVRARVFNKPALQMRRPRGDDEPASVAAAGDGASVELRVAEPAVDIDVKPAWAAAVDAIQTARPRVGAMLRQAVPVSLRSGVLLAEVPNELCQHALQAEHDSILPRIADKIREVESIHFRINAELAAAKAGETAHEVDPYEYLQQKRAENAVLQVLFDDFGGEIAP